MINVQSKNYNNVNTLLIAKIFFYNVHDKIKKFFIKILLTLLLSKNKNQSNKIVRNGGCKARFYDFKPISDITNEFSIFP